jgi:hypothetical protein
MKRRFPIGIQDFVKLREENFLYVDKTERIHQLVSEAAGPVFLSRPRRFGKSLLCSTLGAFFEGKRELFAGLAIDALERDWKPYPVVRLDLNPGRYTEGVEHLDATINRLLKSTAGKYELDISGDTISDRFASLIEALHKAQGDRVVVYH